MKRMDLPPERAINVGAKDIEYSFAFFSNLFMSYGVTLMAGCRELICLMSWNISLECFGASWSVRIIGLVSLNHRSSESRL